MDYVIQNGQLVMNDYTLAADLGIENGKITAVTKRGELTPEVAGQRIDAGGLHVFPGFIDVHVHLNEPGRTEWEGLETGTKALAAGGISTFFDMPLNSNPPTTTAERVRDKRKLAAEKAQIEGYWWGALVPDNIEQLQALKDEGVIGFKAFMTPSGTADFQHADDDTLLKGMEKIAAMDKVLAVHAESKALIEHLTSKSIAEGRRTIRDYERSRPIESEIEAIKRILTYAEWSGCKLHICHISSPKVLEPIMQARAKGVDVTVETCPHYLYFSLEDFEQIGPAAKCAPPLRTSYEVDGLWEALLADEIDIVSSDHSPAPFALKTEAESIFESWGGIAGAQNSLDVLLTEGYHRRGATLSQLVNWCAVNPAKRFGLYPSKGQLGVGADADLTLIDLNKTWTLKEEDLKQRHKETPYVNQTFAGKVEMTFSQGSIKHLADRTLV
ncbi:allantoinase AllB [Salsuginibacillus kocurii]|uniref:allantoinase AllB n=1 Tax=Salsuginibacillus kocurii TaxID=427078 RepID=UPI000368DEBA|nr:allantoinase AllB [Salsuginibacillus kocurii]